MVFPWVDAHVAGQRQNRNLQGFGIPTWRLDFDSTEFRYLLVSRLEYIDDPGTVIVWGFPAMCQLVDGQSHMGASGKPDLIGFVYVAREMTFHFIARPKSGQRQITVQLDP